MGQGLVGHRDPGPHLFQKVVLGDERSRLPQKQAKRIQIARAEFHRLPVAAQAAVCRIQAELIEPITGGRAFQDNLSLCSCRSPAVVVM